MVKRFLMVMGLLGVPGIVGGMVYWQRLHSLPHMLVQARAAVGTSGAGDIVTRIAERYPDQPEVLFLLGRQYRLDGKNRLAQEAFQRSADKGWPRPLIDRELLLIEAQAQFQACQPKLQAYLDANPDDREIALALASGYCRTAKWRPALDLLQPYLDRFPNDGKAHCLRGEIYLHQRHLDLARCDLAKAIAEGQGQPYIANARMLFAICLLDLGQFSQSLDLFQQALADDPNNPKAWYGVGRCARYLNDNQKAQEAFESVLRLRADHVDSLLQLAYIYEEEQNLPKALDVLRRAENLDPNWYEVPFRLAKIMKVMGKPTEAERYEKRYLEMRERWLKRTPGQTPEDVFGDPSAFPPDLLNHD